MARHAPDCIVNDLLYADVAALIAPGGTGKTTLILSLAVSVVLGKPFLGLPVERSGPVLILTGEDTREMLVARLRSIAKAMGLDEQELNALRERIIISDLSGSGFRLTTIVDDAVRPAPEIDVLAKEAAKLKLALVVIDPAVSFGVGESRINDAEQALIEAGRRLRRTLDCCVLYVHHTGKANARNGARDQYAGRGGSAFADGARMVHVLQALSHTEWKEKTGLPLGDGEQGLVLARPKISYCPAKPDLYIRRAGYAFSAVAERADRRRDLNAMIEQLVRLVASELGGGSRHSGRSLVGLHGSTDMSRQQMRDALEAALIAGKIVELDLPENERRGRRKTYLALPDNDTAHVPMADGALSKFLGNETDDSPANG